MLWAAIVSYVKHAWSQYFFKIFQRHASSQRDHSASMRGFLKHLIHGFLVGFTANQDDRDSMSFNQYIDETCKRRSRPLLDRISCGRVDTNKIAVQECLISSHLAEKRV